MTYRAQIESMAPVECFSPEAFDPDADTPQLVCAFFLRSPIECGQEFDRTRTRIRSNVDTVSSQRGQLGRLLGVMSAMLGRVSAIVGAVSAIVGLVAVSCPV